MSGARVETRRRALSARITRETRGPAPMGVATRASGATADSRASLDTRGPGPRRDRVRVRPLRLAVARVRVQLRVLPPPGPHRPPRVDSTDTEGHFMAINMSERYCIYSFYQMVIRAKSI